MRGRAPVLAFALLVAGCPSRFATDDDLTTATTETETTATGTNGTNDDGVDADGAQTTSADVTDWALAFDGAGGGVTPSLPGLPEEYTIEFWVQADGALHGSLVSTFTGGHGWWFFQEEGQFTDFDNVLVYIDYGASDWNYVVDPDLDLNDAPGWHHIAATKGTDGIIRLFHDGALVAEQQFTTPFAQAEAPLWVGTNDVASYPLYDARIDDLRISSVVRYGDVFAPPANPEADADTLYLWTFDEGDGAEAIDAVQETVLALTNPVWVEGVAS